MLNSKRILFAHLQLRYKIHAKNRVVYKFDGGEVMKESTIGTDPPRTRTEPEIDTANEEEIQDNNTEPTPVFRRSTRIRNQPSE